jgi:hypothetical protein
VGCFDVYTGKNVIRVKTNHVKMEDHILYFYDIEDKGILNVKAAFGVWECWVLVAE